jgi:hypothetical protein
MHGGYNMQKNKLFEKVAASPNDMLDWFNAITINPVVRSAGMGAAGYYGSKWAYNKMADKMASTYLDQIKDPEQKQKEWDAYTERRNKIQPWISGTFATIGAGLPLIHPMALSQQAATYPNASFTDVVKPFFQNKIEALKDMSKLNAEDEALMKVAEYYMSSAPPYVPEYNNSANDATLGASFIMPGVRPLTFWNVPDIPKHQSINLLNTQIPIIGRDNTQTIIQAMHDTEGGGNSGMITTGDIFKGLIRTGVGAGVGYTLANVLGTVMAQPAAVKSKMAHYGAIGGAVVNSGILGYGWDKMHSILNSELLGRGQNAMNEMLT